jgi:hypothetical protein
VRQPDLGGGRGMQRRDRRPAEHGARTRNDPKLGVDPGANPTTF